MIPITEQLVGGIRCTLCPLSVLALLGPLLDSLSGAHLVLISNFYYLGIIYYYHKTLIIWCFDKDCIKGAGGLYKIASTF